MWPHLTPCVALPQKKKKKIVIRPVNHDVIIFLRASRNNKLEVSELQEPTGEDVCSKRGAIYIYETVPVCEIGGYIYLHGYQQHTVTQ